VGIFLRYVVFNAEASLSVESLRQNESYQKSKKFRKIERNFSRKVHIHSKLQRSNSSSDISSSLISSGTGVAQAV
jgi:hypothetical protein